MAGSLVVLALLAGYAVGHRPKAKPPSQALVPSATPTVNKQALEAAARHVTLPPQSLKALAEKPPPPPPPPAAAYVPSYSNRSAGYQPARRTYRAERRQQRYSNPAPVYRRPVYDTPAVHVNMGGGGIQAQINGPGGIQIRSGFR